ncbi:hypothetical protein [Persicitalea jodogahamensis]|uniref:Uncharacterized protein n=1 Tax=Persicitalea jodogahamensis TaxID=402147 RepID=A0A8J3D478_9BACT|nr:hypothetical protein [Persicitalea jodogahamensis]GHB71038.1 hypothetical protein GCM10007390_26000 [Persicitalea jodogahamensis]
METQEKADDPKTILLKDIGLATLPKPYPGGVSTRSSVVKKYAVAAKDVLKGPLVFVNQGISLTPGTPQGKLKSHLSFFQASMVLTESSAGNNNNMVLFGSQQQNGQWLGSDGSVQVEFETEDTKTAYLVEFFINLPNLSGPPEQWNLTLVGYMNGVLTTVDHSFSSSQKGNKVLQFFVSPSPIRNQFLLLRPTWQPNKPTSTWNFYGVEITAFKS